MAGVRTRKQREQDLATMRQGFTIFALIVGVLAWLSTSSMAVGLVGFIAAFLVIESLLLLPDVFRRRRLRTAGYDEVHSMNGEQFEEYLEALFRAKGYQATLTANGADFGADLILQKDGRRTAVQAKHWVKRDVGVAAIQEVHAARAHYKADDALVVTVAGVTRQAIRLAKACKVELWDGRRLEREVLALGYGQQSTQQALGPQETKGKPPDQRHPPAPGAVS